MNFTHEEIIQVELALEKQLSSLLEAKDLVAEEDKEAVNNIVKVNQRALEKAKDLNSKFRQDLER